MATECLNNEEKNTGFWIDAIRSFIKKYILEDCRNCFSINGAIKSFACRFLLSNNTSLRNKNMVAKIGPRYTGCSLHLFPTLFYMCVNQ